MNKRNLIDLEKLDFEEAMEELKLIVEKLEAGSLKLEESISLFEKGVKLKDICQNRLDKAKLQISKIIHKDGEAIEIE